MLNKVLLSNSLFSGITGVTIFFISDLLNQQIPGPGWLFTMISIGLILFSAQLFLMTQYKTLADKLILQVIGSDIGWVVLSTAGLLSYLDSFSTMGMTLVILINVVVSVLAWMQLSAYRNEAISATDTGREIQGNIL